MNVCRSTRSPVTTTRAQVQPDRAVGDPLQVVGELLGHRRLVAVAHLRESGQAGAHDEPLPVRRQVLRELGEEPRPDRPRADERHVAAQHVPELRDLVELRRLQPASELASAPRRSRRRAPAPRCWPMRSSAPRLIVRNLSIVEEAATAADALAAVEHRPAARHEHDERDHDARTEARSARRARARTTSSVRSSTSMRRCGASAARRV